VRTSNSAQLSELDRLRAEVDLGVETGQVEEVGGKRAEPA